MGRIGYNKPYDKNYRIVAAYLVSTMPESLLNRILTDDEYLNNLIIKEVQDLDLSGAFVDCIIQDIEKHNKRMDHKRALQELGKYYITVFNAKKLRTELVKFAKEMGIDLGI